MATKVQSLPDIRTKLSDILRPCGLDSYLMLIEIIYVSCIIKDGSLQNNVQCIIHHVDIEKLKFECVFFMFLFPKKKKTTRILHFSM